MIERVAIGAAALILVLMLVAACGGGSDDTTPETSHEPGLTGTEAEQRVSLGFLEAELKSPTDASYHCKAESYNSALQKWFVLCTVFYRVSGAQTSVDARFTVDDKGVVAPVGQ